ncbi:MAG: DUF1592 domain-containing protein [Myxococcota bacterium]
MRIIDNDMGSFLRDTRIRVTQAIHVAVLSLLVVGCNRGADQGDDPPPGGTEAGGSDGSTGTSEEEDVAVPFPAGIRRLTRLQVENAYRHVLLHDDLILGDRLPLDPSTDDDFEFDTVLAAFAPFGASDVIKFDNVALSVVGEVFALPSTTLLDCTPTNAQDECSQDYLRGMLRRAFRRPATESELDEYADLAQRTQDNLGDPLKGLEFATATALQSPWFLYHAEFGDDEDEPADQRPLGDHALAARLSFFLWNAPPDEELSALADAGELQSEEVIRTQARRLLSDPRGRETLKNFFTQWFGYGSIEHLPKNSGVFPDFGPELASGMRAELDHLVLGIIDGAPYDSLFTSRETWVTPQLAALYGIDIPGGDVEAQVLEHWEAEVDGQGCNADDVPPEFHNLCSEASEIRRTFVVEEKAASHAVMVRAYATQGGDEVTRLRVTVDGNPEELEVVATSGAPAIHSVPVQLEPGEHEVILQLANDFYEPPENRDVIVDWIEVVSHAAAPDAVVEAELPPERRGLLTRAGILSVYAKPIDTSPTTRGLFIRQRLLCEIVPDPPPGVATDLPPPSEDVRTNRERVAQHMSNATCAACHQFIDPLGLALEHFDGIGAYRETQDGIPLDVSGSLDGVDFDGALEMGELLADDPRVMRCAAKQLTRFALGQHESFVQLPGLEELMGVLDETRSWPALVEALVLSDLFRTVSAHRED